MKIGAIGIRTKIIVGDAATWHLVKKYLDNVVIKNGGVTPEERAKLAEYPEFPAAPEGYYLADDGTFKALPDFVTDSEMIDYVGSEMAAGSVVIKEYVDQQDALKVDKVAGKGLSTEDYTTAEKSKVANVPLNTNAELGLKVDKVDGSSLVPDLEIAKLAGIEENANDYTHPETHPASILDVVDVVNGAANKFLNERGEMVAVATSSIGVAGSPLYASTENSDVAGYKSLVGTPQPLETEILLTAKSSDGIVWGSKYLSAPFTEAVTIPTTAYGFDYWRKVSAANGTSRKHLRVFLYRAGVETNISTPLASPDIEDTEFTERQISYIFPELVLLAGDRIGIQEGFSTTHANNITLTYIVGDGRGWFMRLPLPIKHENLTDKNSEAAFQHVDTTTVKPTLGAADKVPLYDSVTGKVVLTAKSNFVENHELLIDYTHSGNKEIYIQSVDVDLNTFTSANHGLSNGNILWPVFNDNLGDKIAGSVMPGGFTTFRNYPGYYVVNSTINTFQLSTTINGTAIDITTNPNMDLNKWHFEDGKGADNYIFSNLKQGLKNVLIKIVGKEKRFGSIGHVSVNGQASLPNWHSQVVTSGLWYQNGISCLGNIWSDAEIVVNTQSFMKVTVFALRARQNTSTANTADIIDKISVCTDQNYKGVDISSIGILNSGFANGLNLKIYQIK